MRAKYFLIITLLLCSNIVFAQSDSRKNKIGIIYGYWQPNLFRNDQSTSFLFRGNENSTPYIAINYDYILREELSIHVAIGYCSYLFEENDQTRTLIISPLELGIEHQFIENSILAPYVLYGASLLLGRTTDSNDLHKLNFGHFDHTGLGLFFLTGIRVAPFGFMDFDVNFGYFYAKFPQTIGPGDDFSGLRTTIGINYLF